MSPFAVRRASGVRLADILARRVPGSGNDAEVFVPIEILSSLRAGSNQANTTVAPTPAHFHTAHFFAGTPTVTPTQSYTSTPNPNSDPVQLAPAPDAQTSAFQDLAASLPRSLDLSGTSFAPPSAGAGTAAIAIPLPSPLLAGGPPPPTWAESVSPDTPGGWLSMPPSYFASELVRVEEEVGSPAEEEGAWAAARARRPSLVGVVGSFGR